ncbi:hypothetical protein Rsub_09642 [Raphidocelis subcapitata]|uniref:Uncharacterized protein n=1 Tax=Raphidocelis subcapitata TaxID=307507 RepID=A0A2V0PAA8_9CHLO|nr:hypothetical protein Rsub_09642 [Raphidocelis subcapitata]|eukprot:GBF96786.1 hypothetical protein Rsub_09642 [Raphidocelis subcapitata]
MAESLPGAAIATAVDAMDLAYGPWAPAWSPAPFSLEHSHAGRYLWSDAFGVCNYCSLYYETGDETFLRRAESLVKAVHDALGFDRPRRARLPGASEEHPTRGGLRIGKADAEGPDGDGQYLHYLTKWAFALLQAPTDEPRYLEWALELAEGTFLKFLCLPAPGGGRRLSWKMDAALTRPLVASSGNLDAFDALVTWRLLSDAAGRVLGDDGGRARLASEIAAAERLVAPWWRGFASDDPLDLGEALWLAHWYCDSRLLLTGGRPRGGGGGGMGEGKGGEGPLDLGEASGWVAAEALRALEGLFEAGYFERPAARRLAFREFGASLGVQAVVSRAPELPSAKAWARRVAALHRFWRGPALTARDRDISPIMYAASLLPRVWIKG